MPRTLKTSAEVKKLLSLAKKENEPGIFAGRFSDKDFFVTIGDRGLVLGPPGTGKTTFLVNQILRATKDKLSFVAIDFKPELHSILKDALKKSGYRVLCVNPCNSDFSSDHWNPLEAITDETELAELCNSLLPIRNSGDAPFVEAQRDWLKAGIFHIKNQPGGSLPAAYKFLSDHDPEALLAILTDSPNETAGRIARRISGGLAGKKPDPLILAGLSQCLRSLDYLSLPGVQATLGHSDFDAREIGKNNEATALFLQFDETRIGALGPLLAFSVATILSVLIDSALARAPVILFLDELGTMPPLPNLDQKLNTLRSRNIPVWMYFQTAQQIENQYGKGKIETFFAAADAKLFFRLNDEETRNRVSALIGTTSAPIRSSAKNSAGGETITTRNEQRRVIEPHALGELAPGQVVCLYRGAAALGKAPPYYKDFPEFARKK